MLYIVHLYCCRQLDLLDLSFVSKSHSIVSVLDLLHGKYLFECELLLIGGLLLTLYAVDCLTHKTGPGR